MVMEVTTQNYAGQGKGPLISINYKQNSRPKLNRPLEPKWQHGNKFNQFMMSYVSVKSNALKSWDNAITEQDNRRIYSSDNFHLAKP